MNENNKWIPCIEKLPSYGQYVLASVNKNKCDGKHAVIILKFKREDFWFNGIVDAWQPVPKPYRKENIDRTYEVGFLKPCPFCGTIPSVKMNPLWSGSHGYHGCYEFNIHCHKCGCHVNLGKNDTVYNDAETARQNAINAWNKRVKI